MPFFFDTLAIVIAVVMSCFFLFLSLLLFYMYATFIHYSKSHLSNFNTCLTLLIRLMMMVVVVFWWLDKLPFQTFILHPLSSSSLSSFRKGEKIRNFPHFSLKYLKKKKKKTKLIFCCCHEFQFFVSQFNSCLFIFLRKKISRLLMYAQI